MEVHHSHHPSHKKKWAEYLLEFFMLFVAVTMGFFAENIREQHVIKEKQHDNMVSLIEDLHQDSMSIQLTAKQTADGIKYLEGLQNALYRYHSNQMDKAGLTKYVKEGIFNQYMYPTFFLNGSTYKNMLAAGLISRIESPELKKQITFYYEAMADRLKIHNSLVDQNTETFYHQYFPFSFASIFKMHRALGDTLHAGYVDQNTYLNFYFKQKHIEDKLISPELIPQTDAVLMRAVGYSMILKHCLEQNHDLLEKLKTAYKE